MDNKSNNSKVTNSLSNSVFPHLLNGHFCEENKSAFSLSTNGYIAYGCHNKIIVLETINSVRICQNLNKHKFIVTKVFWCNDNSFKLLSCDLSGFIIVWNVIEGSVLNIISPQNKEEKIILDISWTKLNINKNNNESKQFNILCLYENNLFVLYDSEEGNILWKKSFFNDHLETTYLIKNFQLDPFNDSNLVASLSNTNSQNSECCFLNLKDVLQKSIPIIYQIYVANFDKFTSSKFQNSTNNYILQRCVCISGNSFSRNLNTLINVSHLLEYIKIIYHSSNIDQVLVVFEREMHIIDLNYVQVLCVIKIENNISNLINVYSCWQRNILVCLHQNGSLSYRILQKKKKSKEHIGTDVMKLSYHTIALSDGIRLTKYNKIFGFEVNKINEIEVFLILNNEKINVYKFHSSDKKFKKFNLITLSNYITLNDYIKCNSNFNLIMSKYFTCLTKGKHVMKTGPHLMYKNWFYHKPLVAVGDSSGLIQIFNLATNELEKEYSIHSVSIRGIEWVNLNVLLSFAYGSNGTKQYNELKLTNIISGYSISLRKEKNSDLNPIQILKVSNFKNYFIITFKNELFEIWDLKNLCCLKQITSIKSKITTVEWIPMSGNKDLSKNSKTKEFFMITNSYSELFYFYVDGSTVKKILSTPHLTNDITETSWKNDQLVFGDLDGNITLWNLRTKVSKAECTLRGPIKKFQFGPGKNYLKLLVLFNNGVDLWDVKEMKLDAQIKFPRDIEYRIEDIDWACVDMPMMLTSEGFLIISDSKLKTFYSSINIFPNTISNLFEIENNDLSKINFQTFCNVDKLKFSTQLINKSINIFIDVNYISKCIILSQLIGRLDFVQFFYLVNHYLSISNSYNIDTYFENYVKNDYYKELQKEKIAIYELKRIRYEHNQICNEYHLYLGNDQRTVQLLLETETNSKNLYLKDSLKACLVSLLSHSEKSSINLSYPVVKLVATNLIANEFTDEGVQLLFIIGKTIDACRYLQSNNLWKKSIFLSKTNLDEKEFHDINVKWPDYLALCKKDKDRLFALVSLKMYDQIIKYLYDLNEILFASLFCDICIENNLISKMSYEIVNMVYQKYIINLKNANLDDLVPFYLQRINYLEDKIDKFILKLDEKKNKTLCKKLNFTKGYLTKWNESNILEKY